MRFNFDGDVAFVVFRGIWRFNKSTIDGVFDLVGDWSHLRAGDRAKRIGVLAARTIIGLALFVPYFYPPLLIMTAPPYGYLSVCMAIDIGASLILSLIKFIRHKLGYARTTPVQTIGTNANWLMDLTESVLAATPTTPGTQELADWSDTTLEFSSEDEGDGPANIPGQAP